MDVCYRLEVRKTMEFLTPFSFANIQILTQTVYIISGVSLILVKIKEGLP